jgi:hypothetical protein
LARQNDEDSLSSELESRLDDLFGEDDKFTEGPLASEVPDDYPLAELKNLVLSIDWEITDEVLINFLSQIKELKTTYKDDKIILTFLQILGSLGEYIKTNRGKAHPKTFKILNSVFSRFDDVILSKDMQESEKKRILRTEMAKYKELRTRISREKADKSRKKAAKPAKKIKSKVQKQPLSAEASPAPTTEKLVSVPKEELTGPGVSGDSYSEEIAKAVEEIKEFIHGEFESFRKALRLSLRQK